MTRDAAARSGDGNAFSRFFVRVDNALEPIFTTTPLVDDSPPVDEQELRSRPCPVCGQPISAHAFEETNGNVIMECPTDERLPEPLSNGPLNEFGMPATGRRLEKYEERQAREEAEREAREEAEAEAEAERA